MTTEGYQYASRPGFSRRHILRANAGERASALCGVTPLAPSPAWVRSPLTGDPLADPQQCRTCADRLAIKAARK